jgi:hypothetical protein
MLSDEVVESTSLVKLEPTLSNRFRKQKSEAFSRSLWPKPRRLVRDAVPAPIPTSRTSPKHEHGISASCLPYMFSRRSSIYGQDWTAGFCAENFFPPGIGMGLTVKLATFDLTLQELQLIAITDSSSHYAPNSEAR